MAAHTAKHVPFKVVAAIDFGTTCTGYAYYYHDGSRNYVDRICTEQAWPGKVGMQAPTTVLMNPKKVFQAFGFKAEQEYEILALKNQHVDWYYFRHFKMALHHQRELTKDMQLEDDKGKRVNALEVFEFAISQIRKHLETHLKTVTTSDIEFEQIRWVITVPAIWRESAKAFMREAALKGGIQGKLLHLAIEPEAAAIFYKEVATAKKAPSNLKDFNPKTKYIILDLGGGTVDTTVHEVKEDGTLKELYAATGNAWGGQTVDEAFTQFIKDLVTDGVLKTFEDNHTRQWITFCKAFDKTKREFTHDLALSTIDNFPTKLIELFEKQKGSNIALHISQIFRPEEVELIGNVLTLNNSIMTKFFDKAINPICDHVEDVLSGLQTNADYMILVGGFSESPVVTYKIEAKFGNRIRVVLPAERSSAVLKGAVMYGIDQSIISSRISPYSYGVNVQKTYQSGIHPIERKIQYNGRYIVRHAYSEHIQKGQDVYIGGKTTVKNYSLSTGRNSMAYMKVFQSTSRTPLFCDESECKNIGTLIFTFPKHLMLKKVKLSVWMTCVGTELVAHAKASDTNDSRVEIECECKLDFLGDPVESSSDFTESLD